MAGMVKGGNSALIYGVSGSFKTSQIEFFAQFIYALTAKKYGQGRRTRLITADGGGYRPLEPAIEAGLIEVFPVSGAQNPTALLKKLSEGYWPAEDPAKPGTMLAMQKWPMTNWETAGVGAYAIEGLESVSDLHMRKLLRGGPKLGEGASYELIEDGEKFYGGNRSYYGFIQGRVYDLIMNFNALPVERVLWTTLEASAEDDEGERIMGPSMAGRAKTAKIPQWFGTCLHLEQYVVESKAVEGAATQAIKDKTYGVRAYFRPHPDPKTGRMHPAKPRVPPAQYAELLKVYPNGYFDLKPTEGINKFLELEEEIFARQTTALSDWRAKIDAEAKARKDNPAAPAEAN